MPLAQRYWITEMLAFLSGIMKTYMHRVRHLVGEEEREVAGVHGIL